MASRIARKATGAIKTFVSNKSTDEIVCGVCYTTYAAVVGTLLYKDTAMAGVAVCLTAAGAGVLVNARLTEPHHRARKK